MNERRGRRGGGRAARQAARRDAPVSTSPYLVRTMPPVEMLDEEGMVQIEENAETILSEIGIAFQDTPEALELWKEAGADVDGELVRFPRGMCRAIISKSAPAIYTQHARNPERSVVIGGNNTVFVPNYGSPFVTDLDQATGRQNVEFVCGFFVGMRGQDLGEHARARLGPYHERMSKSISSIIRRLSKSSG